MQVSATWLGLSDVSICIGCSRERGILEHTAGETAIKEFGLYICSGQPIGPLSLRVSLSQRFDERALPLYRCALSI